MLTKNCSLATNVCRNAAAVSKTDLRSWDVIHIALVSNLIRPKTFANLRKSYKYKILVRICLKMVFDGFSVAQIFCSVHSHFFYSGGLISFSLNCLVPERLGIYHWPFMTLCSGIRLVVCGVFKCTVEKKFDQCFNRNIDDKWRKLSWMERSTNISLRIYFGQI